MKHGKRTLGAAELRITEARGLPPHMRGPIVELADLYTSPPGRGQGDAAALLMRTTVEADLAGVMLFLRVLPGNRTDLGRLTSFYARNGFLPIQAEPLLMVRPHVGMRAASGASAPDAERRASGAPDSRAGWQVR